LFHFVVLRSFYLKWTRKDILEAGHSCLRLPCCSSPSIRAIVTKILWGLLINVTRSIGVMNLDQYLMQLYDPTEFSCSRF